MMKRLAASILLALGLNTGHAVSAQLVTPVPAAHKPWDPAYGGADKSYDQHLLTLREQIAPLFAQKQFSDPVNGQTMAYNLYLPPHYDPRIRYPVVVFMADASTTGKGVMAPLKQGYGAIIWATAESQAKHPAIVLVPSFHGPEDAVSDDWQTTEEVPTILRLLDHVISSYSVDRQRIYATGQSLGGMIELYFNANHPDLFAASMYVGSQWDIHVLDPLTKQRFLYITSAGDRQANDGMHEVRAMLDSKGVPYGKIHFSAKLPQTGQNAATRNLLGQGHAINFIEFDRGTTPPVGTKLSPGNEHMYSFDYAFSLGAARDWLFQQRQLTGVAALYNQGLDAKDKAEAFSHFMAAAKQGDGLSTYQVARAYAHGEGVRRNDQQAILWYQRAVDQGVSRAMLDLGVMYLHGNGVDQDYAQAKALFTQAVRHGHIKAPRFLGQLYEEGLGVPIDYAKARQYYQMACAQGDVTAAARLGWLYERGLGVTKSDREALKWYRMAAPTVETAARNVHPRVLALVKLGQFYEQGRAVNADPQQALQWYRLAAQDNDPTALEALRRLDV